MQYSILLFAAFSITAIRLSRAEGLDWDEVPPQCHDACREVVELSMQCDAQFDSDDAELNCVCTGPEMETFIPQCELCARPYFLDGPDDTWDDPFDLLGDCRMQALEQDDVPGQTTGGSDAPGQTTSESEATATPPPPPPPSSIPPPAPAPQPSPTTEGPTTETPYDDDDDDDANETGSVVEYDGAAGAAATPMVGAAVLAAAAMLVL